MKQTWEIWTPETIEDREVVLAELQEVVTSAHFCNSKRYPALLRYIVETTLADRSDHLKERTLGVAVFHRPPTYDTNTDTVVRYTAGEVRKRLALYYHEEGRDAPLQIHLPAGAYVPEFMRPSEDLAPTSNEPLGAELPAPTPLIEPPAPFQIESTLPRRRSPLLRWATATLACVLLLGVAWTYRPLHRQSAFDDFWAPVLHQPGATLLCTGGVVFQQNNYSGVTTAGREIEYPFVSIQLASAIARVSGVLEHGGESYLVQSSSSTALTDLRDHSVVLLGGYNNVWTIRLLQPLRFHFSSSGEAIVDQQHPTIRWTRDHSVPYSNADDYSIIARFRDPNTGSVVVVVAGLGRNGSEAAALFVTTPAYLKLLERRLNEPIGSKNVEAVLKTNVIDGKTGAPSLVEVFTW